MGSPPPLLSPEEARTLTRVLASFSASHLHRNRATQSSVTGISPSLSCMATSPTSFRFRHLIHTIPSTIRALSTSRPALVDYFRSENSFGHLADYVADTPDRPPVRAVSATKPPPRLKPIIRDSFYSPHHLSLPSRLLKDRRFPPVRLGPPARLARAQDPFYQLSIDPLNEAQNTLLLAAFTTELGRIKSRAQTGLTWRSQRRIGKAIRRAKAMGLVPMFGRHEWDFSGLGDGRRMNLNRGAAS